MKWAILGRPRGLCRTLPAKLRSGLTPAHVPSSPCRPPPPCTPHPASSARCRASDKSLRCATAGVGREWHAARAIWHTGSRWQIDDDEFSTPRVAGRRKGVFSQFDRPPTNPGRAAGSSVSDYDNWVVSEGPEAEIGASAHQR